MSIWDQFSKLGKLPREVDNPDEPEVEVEHAKSGDVVKGKIYNLNKKGFGFIISPYVPFERIFFHWTALVRETYRFPQLAEGMRVEFTALENEPNDWRAAKIKVLDE